MEDFNQASDYASSFKRSIRSGRNMMEHFRRDVLDVLAQLEADVNEWSTQDKQDLADILEKQGINLSQAKSLISLWTSADEDIRKRFIDFQFSANIAELGT